MKDRASKVSALPRLQLHPALLLHRFSIYRRGRFKPRSFNNQFEGNSVPDLRLSATL
ncbi:hypothetical protein HYC85_004671 [Camellia sinensis]|uniref:Uncharacterized protein n=1 Tax=Camellia sinensis TaxID=4442 RepID=A0A7J7HZ49_CAMSI|nr:hypothetical protein HYC85_004671 [Camellia sinensis]